MATNKVIVRCDDYNGYKNVLFMMETSDDRLGHNYHRVEDVVKFFPRQKVAVTPTTRYDVYSDWSVKARKQGE